MRFEIAFSSLEEKHRVTIVSDGTQLAASIDFAKPITKEAPKELHSLFSKGLVRGGLVLMGNRQSTSDPNEFIKTQAARSGDPLVSWGESHFRAPGGAGSLGVGECTGCVLRPQGCTVSGRERCRINT